MAKSLHFPTLKDFWSYLKKWKIAILGILIGFMVVIAISYFSPSALRTQILEYGLIAYFVALATSLIIGVSVEYSISQEFLMSYTGLFSEETAEIIKNRLVTLNKNPNFILKQANVEASLELVGSGGYALEVKREYRVYNTSRKEGIYDHPIRTSSLYHGIHAIDVKIDGVASGLPTTYDTDPVSGKVTAIVPIKLQISAKSERTVEAKWIEESDLRDHKVFAVPVMTQIFKVTFKHSKNIKASVEDLPRTAKSEPSYYTNHDEDSILISDAFPYHAVVVEWNPIQILLGNSVH